MSSAEPAPFDLATTYVQLLDGPEAVTVPVGDDFWERIDERRELHRGRLVTVFPQSADWDNWEMHPAGEEVLYLLSGELELLVEQNGGQRTVEFRAGAAFLVPRGAWHSAIVRRPGAMLAITYGAGTRHRPR